MVDAAKKILIIEDEAPLAHALELKLKHEGYETQAASDGQSGIDAIVQDQFDLVLLDLIMPKFDGFKVLEAMKAQGNKTPIVVLTNLSQPEDEERAKKFGVAGFFIKSNTPLAAIVEEVNKVLGK